jgi:hypothetical protein
MDLVLTVALGADAKDPIAEPLRCELNHKRLA